MVGNIDFGRKRSAMRAEDLKLSHSDSESTAEAFGLPPGFPKSHFKLIFRNFIEFPTLLLVNLGFLGLGTILTTFWSEMEDFGTMGPDSETSGRDLACGKGLGGRWAYI